MAKGSTKSTFDSSVRLQSALLSNKVYDFDRPLAQYDLILKADHESGMQAAAYRDRRTGEVTIAFRGTEFSTSNDMQTDKSLGLVEMGNDIIPSGNWMSQLRAAQAFTDQVRAHVLNTYGHGEIRITGHSLGGAIAQVEGARTGLETHTYNAPGVRRTVRYLYPHADTSRISNHNRSGDVVSQFGKQVGESVSFDKPAGYNAKVISADGHISTGPEAVYGSRKERAVRNHNMQEFAADLFETMDRAP